MHQCIILYVNQEESVTISELVERDKKGVLLFIVIVVIVELFVLLQVFEEKKNQIQIS